MKKFIKFLPACASLFALASCSSDDFLGNNENVDLSDKIVLKVTDGDAFVTRSSTYSNANIVWEDKDVIRTYDSELQKYDDFKYSSAAGAFLLPEGNSAVDVVDGKLGYAYALYGVDAKNISYAGWKNDGKGGYNVALLKVKDSFDYVEGEDENGVVTYKSMIPRFGVVTDAESEVNPEGKSFETTMYTLAARARVKFEYGNGLGVTAVRARAVKFAEGASVADFENIGQNTAATMYESKVSEKGAPNLAGWFEAVLDPNVSSTSGGGLQPATDASVSGDGASNTITVNVDEDAMEDYTNIIFFPIVPGTYDLILFEYTTDSDDKTNWYYIGEMDGEIARTTNKAFASIATDVEVDGIEIPGQTVVLPKQTQKGLQSVLEEYAKLGKSMKITVNTVEDGITVEKTEGYPAYNTLVLPALAENVEIEVVINGKINGTGETLYIQGATGNKGKWTVNYANKEQAVQPAIELNVVGDFALKTGTSSSSYGKIVVKKADALELNGRFISGEVELLSVGDLKLAGAFAKGITAAEDVVTGNITIVEAATVANTCKLMTAGNINIDANLTINGTTLTTAAASTVVAEDAKVTAGKATLAWNHAGDLTIEGNADSDTYNKVTLTVNSGEVTLNGAVDALVLGEDVESATVAGTVWNLLTTNGVDVTVDGGLISAIDGAGKKAEISSSGKADIHFVQNGDKLTFTSTATAEDALESLAANKIEDELNIYTGAQLLALNAALPEDVETINLCTDVEITEGDWTPLAIYKATSSGVTFNGGENTVSGLAVDITQETSTTRGGFFSQFAGSGKVTVKDLSLEFTTIKGGDRMAGLVGDVKTNVDIENVSVTVSSIEGARFVGGLIGNTEFVSTTGKITIKGGKVVVSEKISGTQSVGGLIGVLNNVEVGVTDADNIVVVEAFGCVGTPSKSNAGKFGMLVGSIYDANSKFTATAAEGKKLYGTNSIAGDKDDELHFSLQQVEESGRYFSFSGSDNNEIGYSPNVASKAVEIDGEEFYRSTKLDNGNAKSSNTINWYGNDVK